MLTFPFEMEQKLGPQIGLIVLQSDESIERDMRRLMPNMVELLVSRVPSGTHVTPDSLAAMEAELKHAAALFPQTARFRAVGYGCTSGTAQIGAKNVSAAIRSGLVADAVTDPVTALIAACRQLSARRIGLLSPYIESVSARLREVLSSAGIAVCAFASFEESAEDRVARITAQSILAAASKLAKMERMDALFISCTNLRTLDVIDRIEAETGLPVFSSNQVLAWHLLRLSGTVAAPAAPGRLWTESAPA
ncbi:MAG: Asp/Glu racemase [Pseudomonadota bacterium]